MRTKDFADVIRRKLASDNTLAAAVDAERFNANVGSVIHEARTQAALTQKELADRLGMHQSAIARLEDADYDGHSFKTLQRIAAALGKRIEVTFMECSVGPCADFVGEFYIDESSWEPEPEPWRPDITEIAITGGPIRPNGATVSMPDVQLRDLRLLKSVCVLGVGRVPKLKQTIAISMVPRPSEPNTVAVTTELNLSGEAPEGQEGLRVGAAFGALYLIGSLDKLTPEQMGSFLPAIAVNNAWPYWREFVQSMTVRMGLPPLSVPLFRPDSISGLQTVRKWTEQPPSAKRAKRTEKGRRRSG